MDIQDFFRQNNRIAIAFSGGVDSAYLLAETVRCGADVKAYYVKSAFQPGFELDDAERTADFCGAELTIITTDILSHKSVTSNPPDRCYWCKKQIMGAIIRAAEADGFDFICDGTNASDDVSDRPGFRALSELGIRSPLRECGITKDEIRRRANELGLEVWSKPAYACLATRILNGEEITAEKLEITEKAESAMFEMGFRDFRVRMRGDSALVQIAKEQHKEALERADDIEEALSGLYSSAAIDPEPR